jgi:hypothetical protein
MPRTDRGPGQADWLGRGYYHAEAAPPGDFRWRGLPSNSGVAVKWRRWRSCGSRQPRARPSDLPASPGPAPPASPASPAQPSPAGTLVPDISPVTWPMAAGSHRDVTLPWPEQPQCGTAVVDDTARAAPAGTARPGRRGCGSGTGTPAAPPVPRCGRGGSPGEAVSSAAEISRDGRRARTPVRSSSFCCIQMFLMMLPVLFSIRVANEFRHRPPGQ